MTSSMRNIRPAAVLRVIYGVCLLAGMSTHAATIWQHGLFCDYGGAVSQFTRAYWTSLTFLDPLAAILLFACPRIGLIATLAIISTDVLHNLWFFEYCHIPLNWMVWAQCAFLIFVIATFPSAWSGLKSITSKRYGAQYDRLHIVLESTHPAGHNTTFAAETGLSHKRPFDG